MWNRIWKRKPNKKEKMITAAVIAALAGTLAASLIYISHRDIMVLKKPVFVSFMGETYEFDGKTTLKWDKKKNEMYLENGSLDSVLPLQGMPVYTEEGDALIVSGMMSYTNPDTNYLRRLSYFGKAWKENQNCMLGRKGRQNVAVNGGYLYDGDNTWIFLEPVTVKIGTSHVELEALSSICVKNQEYVYYYSSADKKAFYEDWTDGDIMAENADQDWSLNLSRDLLIPANGKIQMLIPNPEVLDAIQ